MLSHIYFFWAVEQNLQNFFHERLDHLGVKLIFPDKQALEAKDYSGAEKAEILIGWRPNAELLQQALNLRLIINPGAGVQHLMDLLRPYAQKNQHFQLINNHGNDSLSAQHAVSMLLALTAQLLPHHQWMKQGRWRTGDKDACSLPLEDIHIGLLGYGAINRRVEQLLAPFKPVFHYCHRSAVTDRHTKKYAVRDLDLFIEQVRILIIAVPQTPETIDLIKEPQLKSLGANGILINIARGPVVNESALYAALQNRWISSAGIDVWYDYSPKEGEQGRKHPYTQPFHELDNILLSPHRAGHPINYPPRWRQVFENIERFASGESVYNVVNLETGY